MNDTVTRFRETQYKVLVGLGHPERVEGLMRIASVFARRQKGRIVAVSVVVIPDRVAPEQGAEYADQDVVQQSEEMVLHAREFGAELGISVDPVVKFACGVAMGIATVCDEVDADMILLGFSPPADPGESGDVPARLTERVANMTGPSLAIVAPPDGEAPARMLIPVTEVLDAAVIKDLVKVVAVFGGAQITFIGLLPQNLPEAEFKVRSEALRERIEGGDFEEVSRIDMDARDTSEYLFGAEARQMAGPSHKAAFILRTSV